MGIGSHCEVRKILFLMKSYNIGGVEIVTSILSERFSVAGLSVYIVSMEDANPEMVRRTSQSVHFVQLKGSFIHKLFQFRSVVSDCKIDCIINQWGLPFVTSILVRFSLLPGIRVFSFYHNDPSNVAFVRCEENAVHNTKGIVCLFHKLLYHSKNRISILGFKVAYSISDRYYLLSNSFVDKFKKSLNIAESNKIGVLTNPITIDYTGYDFDFIHKRKEIIFVGRLDDNQKKVSRIIDIWALLNTEFSDWSLTIVGDGPEREKIEKLIACKNLSNISLVGFQKPRIFYERSSILILTSDYEGFPLVLPECMVFGVIPVVYASYSAIYDIINDRENGLIVEPQNGQFSPKKMADSMASLMSDNEKREQMANNAISMVENKFSIDIIYKQWMNLFSEILK